MVHWIVAKAVLGLKTAILAGLGFVTSDAFPFQVASIAGLGPERRTACEFRCVVVEEDVNACVAAAVAEAREAALTRVVIRSIGEI